MSDNLTVRPWPDQSSSLSSEYWKIARAIKQQESIYPRQSREMIKAAVELAFAQPGAHRNPQVIERFVAMYLSPGETTQ